MEQGVDYSVYIHTPGAVKKRQSIYHAMFLGNKRKLENLKITYVDGERMQNIMLQFRP